MSDARFQRPGAAERPATGSPPDSSSAAFPAEAIPGASVAGGDRPALRGAHGPLRWIVAGVTGLVAGGAAAAALSAMYFARPEPVPINIDTFPEYVLGLARVDIQGQGEGSRAELEADLARQVDDYRFAYGGDGAASTTRAASR